jgi:hypothetical protein
VQPVAHTEHLAEEHEHRVAPEVSLAVCSFGDLPALSRRPTRPLTLAVCSSLP